MGADQNYGPFWGLYYSIFLTIQETESAPIILINSHMRIREAGELEKGCRVRALTVEGLVLNLNPTADGQNPA